MRGGVRFLALVRTIPDPGANKFRPRAGQPLALARMSPGLGGWSLPNRAEPVRRAGTRFLLDHSASPRVSEPQGVARALRVNKGRSTVHVLTMLPCLFERRRSSLPQTVEVYKRFLAIVEVVKANIAREPLLFVGEGWGPLRASREHPSVSCSLVVKCLLKKRGAGARRLRYGPARP